jgi:RimJ/RimL family protein N-acetyltransferase
MSDDVIIRRSEIGDIESWRRTVGMVARESRFLAFQGTPPKRSAAALARMVMARGLPQFFAVVDGEVVGWCDIVPSSDREVFAHRGTLGIGLLEAYRGRGLGRALIETTVAAAWAFGFRRIELRARADNVRAIRLYKSVGFRLEGLMRRAVSLDGIDYDEVAMAILADDVAGEDPS